MRIYGTQSGNFAWIIVEVDTTLFQYFIFEITKPFMLIFADLNTLLQYKAYLRTYNEIKLCCIETSKHPPYKVVEDLTTSNDVNHTHEDSIYVDFITFVTNYNNHTTPCSLVFVRPLSSYIR